jgi:hypothetical protein
MRSLRRQDAADAEKDQLSLLAEVKEKSVILVLYESLKNLG